MMKARFRAVALSGAISLAGCSTTATIHRTAGPAYEATIRRSDPTSVEVLGDDEQTYRVPCAEVADIDHPGNVLATVGAGLLGIAGLGAWSIAKDGSQADSKNAATAIGVVYGLPGLLMAVVGGSIWLSSKSNAKACEESPSLGRGRPFDRPAYVPPGWGAPTWPPPPPPGSTSKPPIRLEAEPMAPAAPPAPPPQADPPAPSDQPSFRPAPLAPAPEPAPQ